MGYLPSFTVVTALIGLSFPALAAETLDRTALTAMPIEIVNSGSTAIDCEAEIAHWFAQDLGRIEPGGQATLDLHFQAATGAWAAINARGEALPVERAWCGIAGRSYATRHMLDLARTAPQPQRLDCRAEADSLACR